MKTEAPPPGCPPVGAVIDAWADGLRTRVATGLRVDGYHEGSMLLSRPEAPSWWAPTKRIPAKSSWRLTDKPKQEPLW